MEKTRKTPGDAFRGRDNNLGLLRTAAALLVILGHAYNFTTAGPDPLARLTDQQATLGQAAVLLFFFYGGFLIMKSMESKRTAGKYFKARALRIFPLLWIVVALSVLALGPAMTTEPLGAYFSSTDTWKYLLNGLLVPVHELPGVFRGNTLNATVNGSLWTLPVEFGCYILCFVFYKLGLADRKKALWTAPAVCAGAAAGWILFRGNAVLQSAVLPILIFYTGMLCYLYRDRIPLNGYAALGAAGLLVLSVVVRIYPAVVWLAYSYILLYIGFGTKRKASGFGKKLEISYAMYLTAYPVQQILNSAWPEMAPIANFLITAAVTILIGIPLTMIDRMITQRSMGK